MTIQRQNLLRNVLQEQDTSYEMPKWPHSSPSALTKRTFPTNTSCFIQPWRQFSPLKMFCWCRGNLPLLLHIVGWRAPSDGGSWPNPTLTIWNWILPGLSVIKCLFPYCLVYYATFLLNLTEMLLIYHPRPPAPLRPLSQCLAFFFLFLSWGNSKENLNIKKKEILHTGIIHTLMIAIHLWCSCLTDG